MGASFVYSMSFKFKDGKIKIQIGSDAEALAYKNKKGKKYKWQTFESVCSDFNSKVISIKEYNYDEF